MESARTNNVEEAKEPAKDEWAIDGKSDDFKQELEFKLDLEPVEQTPEHQPTETKEEDPYEF